jgi:hypothetical protein
MPVHNFLRAGTQAPLLLADMVFQITVVKDDGSHRQRPVGHAGLVARPKAGHALGDDVVVYHMTSDRIEKHRWADGRPLRGALAAGDVPITDCRVDVGGTTPLLEESERRNVISRALGLFQRPTKLNPAIDECCYWLGEPSATGHPNRPPGAGGYAFSCATFVHHCYTEAGVTLVSREELPALTPADRGQFERWGFRAYIPPDPVRRLSCGHLICALAAQPEPLPFQPAEGDWTPCADGPTFERLITAATWPPEP